MENSEREVFIAYSQLPKFKAKVDRALDTIASTLSLGSACVSVSWGKDSTVLLHLVRQIAPDITAISFTHPERELISNYAEVESQYRDRFELNLENINIEGDHVPDKVKIARLWEKYPVNFIGLRAEESVRRAAAIKYGLTHQYRSGRMANSWRCCPIGYWTWQDVWAYICAYDLPYLEIYDRLSRDRGRTTDHLSKSTAKAWQQRRLEELKITAPNYANYLRQNHAEMFY